nr:hypothetical protein [Desulfobacterales bacterium]
MGRCINHPDRETSLLCMKDKVYVCEESLRCRDPGIYCKFGPSCPTWFMRKQTELRGTDRKYDPHDVNTGL